MKFLKITFTTSLILSWILIGIRCTILSIPEKNNENTNTVWADNTQNQNSNSNQEMSNENLINNNVVSDGTTPLQNNSTQENLTESEEMVVPEVGVSTEDESDDWSDTNESVNNEYIDSYDSIDNDDIDNSESTTDSSTSASSTIEEELLIADYSENGHTFTIEELSTSLIQELESGNPLNPEKINYDNLRLVTVTHYGFDYQYHEGELIVHKEVANDIIEIFKEVLEVQYPIEKMQLLEEYNYSDRDSMSDNNSSAYNYRTQENSKFLSMHAYGLAVDINPVQNPYVNSEYFLPTNGMLYLDRSKEARGMIQKGDALYNAFVSRGWQWGGEFTTVKDYQHFEKRID